MLANRHQHFAAQMAAFFLGCELVFEMHAGSARLDHRLHQLVGIERTAEPGLGIGDDRRHPVSIVTLVLRTGDLVGAAQCIIDAPDHIGDRIHGIKRLVRIHLGGRVGVGSNLPAGQINRLQTGLDLLHGLIAGQGAERRHEGLGLQQMAQACGTHFCQCVADAEGAGKPLDIGWVVVSANVRKTVVPHLTSSIETVVSIKTLRLRLRGPMWHYQCNSVGGFTNGLQFL